MSHWDDELPPLDCHAHLAPDITGEQLLGLGGAQIFGVTRSLAEATVAASRSDGNVTWGCGVHPGVSKALSEFNQDSFRRLLPRFALVGEVGLDGRSGDSERQREVFAEILRLTADQPVILSIHSAGAANAVLDLLEERPHPGSILHWYLGNAASVGRAVALGCYFSVSAAVPDERLSSLPRDRALPETDFPVTSRRGGGKLPGDTTSLETRLASLWSASAEDVRRQFYRNLRDITSRTGAVERLPETLADMLLLA